MRFDVVRRLIQRIEKDGPRAELPPDDELTASEREFTQMVFPLLSDRQELERRVQTLSSEAAALRAALDQVPIPALLLGSDGALLALSRAGETLFGSTGVPAPLLMDARRLRGEERSVSVTSGRGAETFRLIPGSANVVWIVPAGTTIPLDRGRLAGRYGLTDAEARVVDLAAQGLTNNEIADRLGVSFETIRTQVSRSLGKMNVKNRSSLASIALAAAFGIGPEDSS